MKIRKEFKFSAGHIVRNCSSQRCSHSMHGHNYTVEVFFESNTLDNGGMVLDFGLTKTNIKDFIDGFDHCWQMWNKEPQEFQNFVKKYSERWISLPVSPSAENYALMFLFVLNEIIDLTEFNNGEQNVKITSVRVHETDTGYAEAFRRDLHKIKYTLNDIKLSKQVQNEFTDPEMFKKLKSHKPGDKIFINPIIEQQV